MWTDTIKERAEEKMGRFINLLKCELSIKYITLKKKEKKIDPSATTPTNTDNRNLSSVEIFRTTQSADSTRRHKV